MKKSLLFTLAPFLKHGTVEEIPRERARAKVGGGWSFTFVGSDHCYIRPMGRVFYAGTTECVLSVILADNMCESIRVSFTADQEYLMWVEILAIEDLRLLRNMIWWSVYRKK
jgi:hypothetical protein